MHLGDFTITQDERFEICQMHPLVPDEDDDSVERWDYVLLAVVVVIVVVIQQPEYTDSRYVALPNRSQNSLCNGVTFFHQ